MNLDSTPIQVRHRFLLLSCTAVASLAIAFVATNGLALPFAAAEIPILFDGRLGQLGIYAADLQRLLDEAMDRYLAGKGAAFNSTTAFGEPAE